MACYRAGRETGELDLEVRRERRRSAVSTPAFLAGVKSFSSYISCNRFCSLNLKCPSFQKKNLKVSYPLNSSLKNCY